MPIDVDLDSCRSSSKFSSLTCLASIANNMGLFPSQTARIDSPLGQITTMQKSHFQSSTTQLYLASHPVYLAKCLASVGTQYRATSFTDCMHILTLLCTRKPPCKRAIFKVQLHNCIWEATLLTWQNLTMDGRPSPHLWL